MRRVQPNFEHKEHNSHCRGIITEQLPASISTYCWIRDCWHLLANEGMKTLLLAVLAAVALQLCSAHVRLTFPPARSPDYDFLDNVRTGGPCGVPGMPCKKIR